MDSDPIHQDENFPLYLLILLTKHRCRNRIIDLTSLNDDTRDELKRAFQKYRVIFLETSKYPLMTTSDWRYFGVLGAHVEVNDKQHNRGSARQGFTMTRRRPVFPAMFFIQINRVQRFHLWEVFFTTIRCRPWGGDTLFSSMYAAYDALSTRMKVYLDGLTANHDGVPTFGEGTPNVTTR